MEIKKIILSLIIAFSAINLATAQEFNAAVVVNANAIVGVDQGIFKTLQTSLTNFINQRKWTTEEYSPNEKIDCNMQLTITKPKVGANNAYECTLNVQASRAVFGTDYKSTILNIQDKEMVIRYVQYQPIDFNENNISGADALASNLSATIAYYAYMILGFHEDSHKLQGGTPYFTKAQAIVSNAPEGSGISGWKNDGKPNRFSKIGDILSPRLNGFRNQYYQYHRMGLDQMQAKPTDALTVFDNCIKELFLISNENPGTSLFSMYFSAKGDEYLELIPMFEPVKKQLILNQIMMLDVSNAAKYRALASQ